MYLQFYQLRQAPFQPGAEPAFFWRGEKYLKALEVLQHAIEHGSGVSLLTGDVGTGKTVVVHNLLRLLEKNLMTCLISDPSLTAADFYHLVLHAFHIRRNFSNRKEFQRHLNDLLQKADRRHKKVLLLIDEAQRLSPELTAEIVELISPPLNAAGTLHVCLVAQTDAGRRCIDPVIKALGQHIMADFHIDPLDPVETVDYVLHRLKVAGAASKIFSDEALEEVFRHSGGYPIQINLICDFSLFSGFAERAPVITEDIVRWSAESLRLPESADELSDMEILGDEISEDSWETDISDQFEDDEEYAAVAGHEIIEPDAEEYSPEATDRVIEPDLPEKPNQFDVPQVPDTFETPVNAVFRPPEKQRRSFLKPALAAAAALIVIGGGYVFYNLKPNPLADLLNRTAPRISATSNAPAPEKVMSESAPLPDSAAGLPSPAPQPDPQTETDSDTPRSQPAVSLIEASVTAAVQSEPPTTGPEKEAKPAAIEPFTETTLTDETPVLPEPGKPQPALAASPVVEPVTAAGQNEPTAAAPEKEAKPAAIEPPAETTLTDETPVLPEPEKPQPALAAAPTEDPVTAVGQREPTAAAPEKEAKPAAIEPPAETTLADEPPVLPEPAEPPPAPVQTEIQADVTPEEAKPALDEKPLVPAVVETYATKPAITEESAVPAIVETDQTNPDIPEKSAPAAVAAAMEKPGPQSADSPSEGDARPALGPETEPPQPVSPIEATPPPLATVNKLLKDILKAGAFYSEGNSTPKDTRETAASPRTVPETSPPKTGPTPAATPDEPDPSNVINWLLKKKGK